MKSLVQSLLATPVRVALLILGWLLLTSWARPLHLPDEGRYVGVAWEMLRSGEWLTPTQNGLPFFHKPPLFYWITAGSISVFGHSVWAMRTAPLLGAGMAAFGMFLFLRRWCGEPTARVALLALMAQPLWFIGGQYANLDMLVAGCISVTILLLAHAVLSLEAGESAGGTVVAAYAMAALGVLAKGLIGAVLPILVAGSWLLLTQRWRRILNLLSLPGLIVFAVLAVPWFAVMQLRYPNFLDYFFIEQHFRRFAVGGFNNVQPFWFYLAVIAVFSLPGLAWLLQTVRAPVRHEPTRRSVRVLMWVWLGAVTAFFSAPASKPLGYILPVVVPIAVLMADAFLVQTAPLAARQRGWWLSVGVAAVLSIASIGWFAFGHSRSYAPLADVLARERQAAEPVLMIDNYAFDIPVLASLPAPLVMVDNWSDPGIQVKDNWRKEFADAAVFEQALAARTLVDSTRLNAQLCTAPVTWIVSPTRSIAAHPVLAAAQPRARWLDSALWRIDRADPRVAAALQCPQ